MEPFSDRSAWATEAWRAVGRVHDPELDEPVTDMGFVERIAIADDGAVALDFRLPTYWCSPNFAFLMLDGVRLALEGLAWRPRLRIVLHDHLFAQEVNEGLAAGRTFGEIFAELAPDDNLEALREKFRRKAFERRQEALIAALRAAGWGDAAIVALDRQALEAGAGAEFVRYAQAFAARFPSAGPQAPALVDGDGAAVGIGDLKAHVARLRSVRINMEFNGALCRGLKDVRYREKKDGELSVVDFLPRSGLVEALR